MEMDINMITAKGSSLRADKKKPRAAKGFVAKLRRDLRMHKWAYIMVLPVIIYYIIFCYVPMGGLVIAFQNYKANLGFLKSQWVGLHHFRAFINDPYFLRIVGNTFRISFSSLLFGFPMPILLALLLNELRVTGFKRLVQTVSYFPYFISLVVVCGIMKNFLMSDGLLNDILAAFGGERISFLQEPQYFTSIYVISNIWQNIGWGSILYLSVLTGISPEYYEAATIDGAGRFRQTLYITLPCLQPTIVIMLILAIGGILNLGYEKIILLYNGSTYEKADVISSYVYRMGLGGGTNLSYATAVGLLNSVCNLAFICGANFISRRLGEVSLW